MISQLTPLQLMAFSLPSLVFSEYRGNYFGSVCMKLFSSGTFVLAGILKSQTIHLLPDANSTAPERVRGRYAFLILAGLLFSALGDFLLIPTREEYLSICEVGTSNQLAPQSHSEVNHDKQRAEISNKAAGITSRVERCSFSFKLGMLSFSVAHVAYIGAFYISTPDPNICIFIASAGFCVFTARILGVISASSFSFSPINDFKFLNWNLLRLSIPAEIDDLVIIYSLLISVMVSAATAGSDFWKIWGALMFYGSDIFVAKDVFGKDNGKDGKYVETKKGRKGWKWRGLGWILYFSGQMVLALSIGDSTAAS